MIRASLALLVVAVACDDGRSPADPPSPAAAGDDAGAARDRSRPLTRFDPPAGFARVALDPGSFGAYLRQLPLRTDRDHVRSYRGARLDSPAAAVATLEVGDRNLQQCADSILRLHAEWLWSRGLADRAAYHFVSGDLSRWRDWRAGERFRVRGRAVERVDGGLEDASYDNFRRYLFHLFAYAGTASMRRDSEPVPIGATQPGDFFVLPGSPGHAVLVMDVAERPDGARVAMLGQGFMPAQEFHIIDGGADALDRVWFPLPGPDGALATPSWKPFPAGTLRRFHQASRPADE